ncbi:hypothetical protein Gogos_022366 [Gossypium gossypioides]|uniref:Uncharacterized protein n=1 Tax=Gossypium gossypioides TaxID=34282 RepID=A0A7J9D3S5_GOSGO|nr:hypothetical protein [Gossypium gossypioides]
MFSNPFFSLNDIDYAYCEVDRNPYLAGLILCEMQRIPPLVSTDQSNNKVKNDKTSRSSYVKSLKKYSQACDAFTADQPILAAIDECSGNGKNKWGFKISKAKGETSFRRHYFEHARKEAYKICYLANGSYLITKPMKADSKEMLMSLFWSEEFKSSSRNKDRMYKDMEDFLFKMLREEFRLERDAIQEVLSKPSYEIIYHC